MFLTSRYPDGLYSILVNTCKIDAEKKLNKRLTLNKINLKKIPPIRYIFYFFLFLISAKIFDKNKCLKYKYKGIAIGRHVLAEYFKNPKTYENKIFFIIKFSINIFKAGQIISTCKFYKKLNVKAVYLDHIFYLNGIFYAFFINQKTIIYTNNFPLSIIRVRLQNRKHEFQRVEGILKLPFEKKNYLKNKNLIKKKIIELTKSPKKFLPWLKNTKYHKILSNKLNHYDYVIYCHSFTDAQLIYGDDGFSSTYEWLIFTLDFLRHRGAKVIIKPHPNFWNSYLIEKDSLINFDRRIYKNILSKYNNVENFLFLKNAISNFELMKKLNKKCILISHHGSVIFEANAMNFKTIFSEATFYSKKYKVSNSWNSKEKYQKLLNKKWVNLKFSNTKDLHMLFNKYFYNDHSYYGKYYWQKVLSDHLKINFIEFTEKIEAKFDELVSKKEINKIIDKSLKCISDVN